MGSSLDELVESSTESASESSTSHVVILPNDAAPSSRSSLPQDKKNIQSTIAISLDSSSSSSSRLNSQHEAPLFLLPSSRSSKLKATDVPGSSPLRFKSRFTGLRSPTSHANDGSQAAGQPQSTALLPKVSGDNGLSRRSYCYGWELPLL